MHKSRFTEEQIIKVPKEQLPAYRPALCAAKCGISDATFYNWRSRYGGMEVSDARKLNALEDENRRLKWSADRSRFVDAQRGQTTR